MGAKMSKEIPLKDLLTPSVDEVEASPDDKENIADFDAEPEAFSTPEEQEEAKPADAAEQKPEATPPNAEELKANEQQQKEDGQEAKKSDGLPAWMHKRLEAADKKAKTFEQQNLELQQKLQAFNQQQPAQPQQGVEPAQQVPDMSAVEAANFNLRNEFGWKFAVKEYGQELPSQATRWAADTAQTDPYFHQRLLSSPDPVEFSVQEFRKAQVVSEMAQHGWDMDAMIKAKMAAANAEAPQQQATPTAEANPAEPANTNQRTPRNFATENSGVNRATGATGGITPLGDLLSLQRGRK